MTKLRRIYYTGCMRSSILVAKEFKEVKPDLGVYPCPESVQSVRRQQQFMLNWLNSAGT
jgi:hypothetical protein